MNTAVKRARVGKKPKIRKKKKIIISGSREEEGKRRNIKRPALRSASVVFAF